MTRRSLLWLVLLGGPAIWFLSFGANFALVPWACAFAWKPALYAVSAIALGLTALCGLTAWNQWHRLGQVYPGEASGEVSSTRALASGAVLLNGMFFLVILAQAIAEIILGACQ